MLGEIEIVIEDTCDIILTNFGYIFWKHQRICGFLIFPGGIKNEALARKGLSLYLYLYKLYSSGSFCFSHTNCYVIFYSEYVVEVV